MTALCSGKICTIFPEKGALNFWKACTIALEYSDVEGCKKICEQAQGIDIIDNIIIVDNMSNDGSYEKLCDLKNNKIRVVQSKKNGGYSYGYNYGLKIAKELSTEYVFICNSDVLFDKVLIKKCIEFLQNYICLFDYLFISS